MVHAGDYSEPLPDTAESDYNLQFADYSPRGVVLLAQ
jgi:hypothetical protein